MLSLEIDLIGNFLRKFSCLRENSEENIDFIHPKQIIDHWNRITLSHFLFAFILKSENRSQQNHSKVECKISE